MRVAIDARVSTTRQAQAQTIEQQLDRLRAAVAEHGWRLDEQHVFWDDGYSGAGLSRPGLDRLRDQAALAELDLVVVTAPDRLARNYVHQVLLLDELGRHGLKVEFLDRPMSHDPHDQLLLGDPRGGRRVRAHADRRADAPRSAGQAAGGHAAALDHTTIRLSAAPRTSSCCGRGPSGARRGGPGGTAVRLVPGATGDGVPAGQAAGPTWGLRPRRARRAGTRPACGASCATRPIQGRALTNRTQVVPARRRKSALLPVGPGARHAPRPAEDWIAVAVPPIVSEETFARVQAKLDTNQQTATRTTRHQWLLGALVSCGVCRRSCPVGRTQAGYR